MQKSKLFLAFLLPVLTLISCKSKFDKTVAEKVLTKDLNLPYSKQLAFVSSNLSIGYGTYNDLKYKGEYALANAGYRNNTVTQRTENIYMPPKNIVNFQFTQNASNFIKQTRQFSTYTKNDIEIGKILLDKVSNFREISESEYEVEFDLKYELNPIGIIVQREKDGFLFDRSSTNQIIIDGNDKYEQNSTYRLDENELKNLKVSIQKYDDGWKINTSQLNDILNKKLGIK